jgi:hypothetical protein
MNITLARELLSQRGYTLDMRDIQRGKRSLCRVYAVNGKHEVFLINMSRFPFLSTARFQQKIATLPGESETTA